MPQTYEGGGAAESNAGPPKARTPLYVESGDPDFDIGRELLDVIDSDSQLAEPHPAVQNALSDSPSVSPVDAKVLGPLSTGASGLDGASPAIDNRKRRLETKKTRGHLHRKRQRAEEKQDIFAHVSEDQNVRPNVHKRYNPDGPNKVVYDTDAAKASVASTAYVGLNNTKKSDRVYTLEEVTGEGSELGFKLQRWNGIDPLLVVNKNGRLIAVLAGRPDDEDWGSVHKDAADALESKRSSYTPATSKATKTNVRRVDCPALACGVSMGGGQTRPMNLRTDKNTDLVKELNGMTCFKRIAGFGSSVMKHRTPKLYAYYVEKTRSFYTGKSGLEHPFSCSVFSAATYNLGPKTVCYRHKDFGNLPFGLCAVTALGSFDYKKGGHLILWECRLVIEFPPGSTILLPSAVVSHSNVAISLEECRYSFVQYTSGSLFRWVDNKNQTLLTHLSSLSPDELEQHDRENRERWSMGLSLLPVIDISKS